MASILPTGTPGKFKVKVSFGSEHNGTRRYKTKVIYGTTRTIKGLAAAWEAEIRAEGAPVQIGMELEPEADPDEDPARPTFAKVLRDYIDVTTVEKGWTPEYVRDRESHLTAVEDTPLAAVVMEDLRRTHLAAHLKAWAATPKRYGGTRGPDSVRARKIILCAVVGYAIADPDIIVKGDPSKGIGTAVEGTRVAELDVPTVAEFARLINAGCDRMDLLAQAARQCRPGYPQRADMTRDVCLFALLSGMRQGEVCGLRSADVTHNADGSAAVLVLHSVKALRGGGWELKRLKTGWHRAITVPAPAAGILLRRQVANETLAMENDVTPPANGFVFSMGWGDEPLMPDGVGNWFAKIRDLEPGLTGKQFKGMRHSHASHLHELGFHDKAIAEHMGHSVEVSKETYNHVRPGHDVQLADAIGKAFA